MTDYGRGYRTRPYQFAEDRGDRPAGRNWPEQD
jgi:hypothetical protein